MKTPTEIRRWLINNLGPRAIAPLTSHDWNALLASVAIAPLISHTGAPECLFKAYAACVLEMQEHTRHLAYHAIATELDWGHRQIIWDVSQLARTNPITTVCCFEAGGGGEERSQLLKKKK